MFERQADQKQEVAAVDFGAGIRVERGREGIAREQARHPEEAGVVAAGRIDCHVQRVG